MDDLTPEEDKDNPAYLDSLGWVLFKKKNFKEAKKFLLEATGSKEGQHIEILDHLADVYMVLLRKGEAVKALGEGPQDRRGDPLEGDEERRNTVEKKLKKLQDAK